MLEPPPPRPSFAPPASTGGHGPPLGPEQPLVTPGAVVVVDEHGVLRDRSPRAHLDATLGNAVEGRALDAALLGKARRRVLVHDGASLESLRYVEDDALPRGGVSERDFGAMIRKVRNQTGLLVASLDTEEMLAHGPISSQVGSTRRREVDRLVDSITALGHSFAPAEGRAPFDLEQVIRRTLDALRGGAKKRSVNLDVQGSRQARRVRTGDESLLQAAISALLVNAIEASATGSDVRVRVEGGSASVTLQIEDDGPGLIAPSIGNVGAPFQSSKRGALGLGLTIAQRAAWVHGGELSVGTRTRGVGVLASLWLPMTAA